MKNLKEFNTESELLNYWMSDECVIPHLSYNKETNLVKYNPKRLEPFTVTALEDCYLIIDFEDNLPLYVINSRTGAINAYRNISILDDFVEPWYSKDGGITWLEMDYSGGNLYNFFHVWLNAGESVQIRSSYTLTGSLPSAANLNNYRFHGSVSICTYNGVLDGSTIRETLIEVEKYIDPDTNKYVLGKQVYQRPKFKVSGNILSLVFGEDYLTSHINVNDTKYRALFAGLFYRAGSGLVDALDLILPKLDTIPEIFYYRMFAECTNLKYPPALSSVSSIGLRGYLAMFMDCTSLLEMSNVNIALIASMFACLDMFFGCESITKIKPFLINVDTTSSSTSSHCCDSMFCGCSSLQDASGCVINSTASSSCYEMFADCVSLILPPKLKATSLAQDCYYCMFYGCTSLIEAPDLPPAEMESRCYYYMFLECTSLIKTPTIIIKDNNSWSVDMEGMFEGCSSLRSAKIVFESTCTSIIDYTNSAMGYMFRNCPLLSSIIMTMDAAQGWQMYFNDSENSLVIAADWVNGVASSGTFYTDSIEALEAGLLLYGGGYGPDAIPTGWQVKKYLFPNENYLGIEILEDNTTISFSGSSLLYSIDDGSTWSTLTSSITFNIGNIVRLKGTLTPNFTTGVGTFDINKPFNVEGNILSLYYGDSFTNYSAIPSYGAYKLFKDSNVVKANDLYLSEGVSAYSCAYLFLNCVLLLKAPELYATVLAESCYEGMFKGCELLTDAPVIIDATLATNCFKEMFADCIKLSFIECKKVNLENCSTDWVKNVASSGTFSCTIKSFYSLGDSGIPLNWTIITNTKNVDLTFLALDDCVFDPFVDITSYTEDSLEYLISFNSNFNIQYSLDLGNTWTTLNKGDTTPTVLAGNTICFKDVKCSNSSITIPCHFSSTGRFMVYGNLDSLNANALDGYCDMFVRCDNLIHASDLYLPTLTGSVWAHFRSLFLDCVNLESFPEIPKRADTLGYYYISSIFANCKYFTDGQAVLVTYFNGLKELGVSDLGQMAFGEDLEATFKGTSITKIDLSIFNYFLSPSSYTGWWFYKMCKNCTELTQIILPSWKFVPKAICDGCSKLPSVTIPETVTNIQENAFNNCTNLNTINILGEIKTVALRAFDNTKWYNSLPDGVTYLNTNILYKYKGTPSNNIVINVSSSVVTIASYAFYNLFIRTRIGTINLPNGVKYIGDSAFSANYRYLDVNIPSSVVSIGEYAFSNYSSQNNAFDINLPNLESLGSQAFYYAHVTTVIIGNLLLSVPSLAFRYCATLTTVTLGSGITSIATLAFRNCSALQSFTCLATTPPTLASDTFNETNNNFIIYVPSASVNAYKAATNWSTYASRIQAIP